jgi:hypothetical protein
VVLVPPVDDGFKDLCGTLASVNGGRLIAIE